ncbi:WXG100 family type VII secretion target, partial [Mycobacterium sp. Y57]|nr:WXG100 family type VII secretion target [Mycolicibacterium xanthum]
MTTPSHPMGAALTTDFDLMLSVAGRTDARNDEIR